jgi:hypothetical protein
MSILMAFFMLYADISGMRSVKKKGKATLPEYQATLSAPVRNSINQDAWIDAVHDILKQNNFESYIWLHRGKKVIDILSLHDRNADILRIEEALLKNGVLKSDIKIDVQKIAKRFDTYTIEFESPYHEISARCAWNEKVDRLLSGKEYCLPQEYDCNRNPAVLDVAYPPFREAAALIAHIQESGLQKPSFYTVYAHYRQDRTDGDFMYSVATFRNSIQISGFVPVMKYSPEIHHEGSVLTVTMVDPAGKTSSSRIITHPVRGFVVNYPKDFMPEHDTVIPGAYKVFCSLNGEKAFETGFELTDTYTVRGNHIYEPEKVFYTRVE